MTPRRSLLIALLLGALLFVSAFAYAQDAKPAGSARPAAASETASPVHKKDLIDLFNEGGKIMYLILLCSIATVYLAIDGILRTSRNRVIPPDQLERVKASFRDGDYVGAYNYLKT